MSGHAPISAGGKAAHKKVWGRKAPWCSFKIAVIAESGASAMEEKSADAKERREIQEDVIGKKGATIHDLVKSLDDRYCRYLLYDHMTVHPTSGRKVEKTHFIFWSPVNATQAERTMYSAYLINFRDDLKYAHHKDFMTASDFKEFMEDAEDSDDDSGMSL